MTTSGYLFDIKHFSTHDGPGIRTTIFFSGCPLKCIWCHNPEAIFEHLIRNTERLLLHHNPDNCIHCDTCLSVCSLDAIKKNDGCIVINNDTCNGCNACIRLCPTNAIYKLATEYEVDKILEIVEKDSIFFEESNGGVTISGGEPFFQPEFLFELISELHKRNINVFIDTSGYFKTDLLIEMRNVSYLFDLKIINDQKHILYTGVSNKQIVHNLYECDKRKIDTIISIPVIPGINTEKSDIDDFIEFLKSLDYIKKVRLLKYHDFALKKYQKLGLSYKLKTGNLDDKFFQDFGDQLKNNGIMIL